jgi:hypothetical protein
MPKKEKNMWGIERNALKLVLSVKRRERPEADANRERNLTCTEWIKRVHIIDVDGFEPRENMRYR